MQPNHQDLNKDDTKKKPEGVHSGENGSGSSGNNSSEVSGSATPQAGSSRDRPRVRFPTVGDDGKETRGTAEYRRKFDGSKLSLGGHKSALKKGAGASPSPSPLASPSPPPVQVDYFNSRPRRSDSERIRRETLVNTLHNQQIMGDSDVYEEEDEDDETEELDPRDPRSGGVRRPRARRNPDSLIEARDDGSGDDDYGSGTYPDSDASSAMLLHVTPPQPAAPRTRLENHGDLANLMDVGLKTSGGLAPGAVDASHGSRGGNGNDDEEKQRRQRRNTILKSKANSAPGSETTTPEFGPDGGRMIDGDIPLLNLDRRLQELRDEVEEKQPDTADLARTIVEAHIEKASAARSQLGENPAEFSGYTVPNPEYLRRASIRQGGRGGDLHPGDSNGSGGDGASGGGAGRATGDETPPSGARTPVTEDYVAPPSEVKRGVLSSLLKLYADDNNQSMSTLTGGMQTPPLDHTPGASPPSHEGTPSGLLTPGGTMRSEKVKWYKHKHARSASSLSGLLLSSAHTIAAPGLAPAESAGSGGPPTRPKLLKRTSGGLMKKRNRLAEQIRITVHIADVLQRQRFIVRMCRALMLYGAPTHRLEEYMKMTSRVLEIDGQFLYIPGCMIVSFDDATTHTSEMQLVRSVQGLNLSKLQLAHTIYKEVVHDIIGVEEASNRVDDLLRSDNLYPPWMCVIFFGLCSAVFSVLSFGGYWPDMPITFVLGGCVGFLQIYVAPRSDLYNNVFEVTSSIIVSFLGRAFGSIGTDQDIFCFASITQGSLALILPGYIIRSLELQSKSIIAGSVRMFYAVIYSLFLSFGITLGATIYGWVDRDATSATTCPKGVNAWYKMLLLPVSAVLLACVNQARWKQLPVMVVIASAGYAVSFFVNERLSNASQIASGIASFVIGVLGNLYSRIGHGLAFAAMLPAIFVQVPSGIASQGTIIAGISTADQLLSNSSDSSSSSSSTSSASSSSSDALTLGLGMIQVAVGITVGLFAATLVIYPLGKKRSSLFTF